MTPAAKYSFLSIGVMLAAFAGGAALFAAVPHRREVAIVGFVALFVAAIVATKRLVPRCPYCGARALSQVGRRSFVVNECPQCDQPLQGPRLSDAELERKRSARAGRPAS
jgi:ribosomal protein L37AE/L43A